MTAPDQIEVDVHAVSLEGLERLLGPERAERFDRTAERARRRLVGRRVVNVNSTATGGGVAEILQTLLAYARGAGIDARWVVLDGDPTFFQITKRIHNHLYGTAGDGGPLGPDEHEHYEAITARNFEHLRATSRSGDLVVLHDPQTAALAPHFARDGAIVVWRCHVGIDTQNERSAHAWEFLRPYLEHVDAFVFSREQFAPPWVPGERLAVIPPSIDPFSAKNEALGPERVAQLLRDIGLLAGTGRDDEQPVRYRRRDGSHGEVSRRIDLLGTGPPLSPSVPVVLQASRWDAMKDMPGVMAGFAEFVVPHSDAHLVLAGPEAKGVADDPEAVQVLLECEAKWRALPDAARGRIHLACVPMSDPDEAAIMVNGLQRHATVVVQKSLAEGFGLTVAEAMWKSRPVVGGAVGGIVDQIVDGGTGLLVDPLDLEQYGAAVRSLLADPSLAARMGAVGRHRVEHDFLGDRHLEQWAHLFDRLV